MFYSGKAVLYFVLEHYIRKSILHPKVAFHKLKRFVEDLLKRLYQQMHENLLCCVQSYTTSDTRLSGTVLQTTCSMVL